MIGEDDFRVMIAIFVFVSIVFGVIASISFAMYKYEELHIDNFQKTINELSEEQKCLHICGFELGSYFDKYKFCIEKCDRISEREARSCGGAK